MSESRRHLMKCTRAQLVGMLETWRASEYRARRAAWGEARAWAKAQEFFYWADAELRGIRLTMGALVSALGGDPSDEAQCNLIWLLKRIDELKAQVRA